MSDDLRQKIIEIICKEWPTPDGYLLGSDIHEHLRRQGVNITDHALNDELAELASRGRIPLRWCRTETHPAKPAQEAARPSMT